jgi:hypothetical protein
MPPVAVAPLVPPGELEPAAPPHPPNNRASTTPDASVSAELIVATVAEKNVDRSFTPLTAATWAVVAWNAPATTADPEAAARH